MKFDANVAPSPLWVRVSRLLACLLVAAVLMWRGLSYDDPKVSTAVPFVMCQLTAAVTAVLGLLNLDGKREPGPA
jgi:hypothetical protein